jgi:hypothetical protein
VSQTIEQTDRQWQEWCRRFDIVFRDVQTMFHNRHVWKNMIEMLKQNSALQETAIAGNWIIRTYISTQCSAVRRLTDDDKKRFRCADAFGICIRLPGWWRVAGTSSWRPAAGQP